MNSITTLIIRPSGEVPHRCATIHGLVQSELPAICNGPLVCFAVHGHGPAAQPSQAGSLQCWQSLVLPGGRGMRLRMVARLFQGLAKSGKQTQVVAFFGDAAVAGETVPVAPP